MCPPKCRNVTTHVDVYVDVFGRAHRPSPTVFSLIAAHVTTHVDAYRADAGVRPYRCG